MNNSTRPMLLVLAAALAVSPGAAVAEDDALQPHREALQKLAHLDGEWRGEARALLPDGQWVSFIQTERVGTMLDGTVRLIEGRGFDHEGTTHFNALAILSWDPSASRYRFHSWAQGHAGEHQFMATDDGFVWEIEAGPALMRYTAEVIDGRWEHRGERLVADQPPATFFEMSLRRLGDTDWPQAGSVAWR